MPHAKIDEGGRHRTVDDAEQIAGHGRVSLKAEKHIARHHKVPYDPHLAVAEPRDCRDAAIDWTPPLAPDRHLDLDAAFLADVDLLHRQRSVRAIDRPCRRLPWP